MRFCFPIAVLTLILHQANAAEPPPVGAAQPAKVAASSSKTFEFQNDQLTNVLRKLAQEAKISLVVSDKVANTSLTMRFENVKPLQAMEIIATSRNLIFNEQQGIYYILTQDERTQALHILDSPALPDALAKFKKRYYDALLKHGFSRDAA